MQGFVDKLQAASRTNRSLLCIGLDPDLKLMPHVGIAHFNRAIIESTADLVCAYKPNLAFYEALGLEGMRALDETIRAIPPDILVIGDAKRGDIGNTSNAYAQALFDVWGFDAVTVSPYMGLDSLEPFLKREDRGVFILCRTSNPGSADFQALMCSTRVGESRPLYEHVALKAKEWNRAGNVGLVVGATNLGDLRRVRELCPDMVILVPGVGAQGGDLETAVRYGVDSAGERAVVVSARQVLYASNGKDFAIAARRVAETLRIRMNDAVTSLKLDRYT